VPGIETIEKEAAKEKAEIARKKAEAEKALQSKDTSDPDRHAEAMATLEFIEAMRIKVTEKYKNATPAFRNRLCVIKESCETTLREMRGIYVKEEE
jgi:hypothetical protein